MKETISFELLQEFFKNKDKYFVERTRDEDSGYDYVIYKHPLWPKDVYFKETIEEEDSYGNSSNHLVSQGFVTPIEKTVIIYK